MDVRIYQAGEGQHALPVMNTLGVLRRQATAHAHNLAAPHGDVRQRGTGLAGANHADVAD